MGLSTALSGCDQPDPERDSKRASTKLVKNMALGMTLTASASTAALAEPNDRSDVPGTVLSPDRIAIITCSRTALWIVRARPTPVQSV